MNTLLNSLNIIVLLLFIILVNSNDPSVNPKEVIQNGDLICLGNINSTRLTVGSNKDFYASNSEMKNVITSELLTDKLRANKILGSILISNNKLHTLFINSFLKIKGQVSYESPTQTSFVQLGHENIFLNGVKQWKLLADFDLIEINKKINTFINSHVTLKGEIAEMVSVSKNFHISQNFTINSKNLKSGKHILIETDFKFVNFLWNNNTAFIKIEDDLYWLEHHNWENNTYTNEYLECDSEKWNSHIRIIIPVSNIKNNLIPITFGIKLNDNFDNFNMKFSHCSNIQSILNDFRTVEFENLHISLK